jgi:hypothetical protein
LSIDAHRAQGANRHWIVYIFLHGKSGVEQVVGGTVLASQFLFELAAFTMPGMLRSSAVLYGARVTAAFAAGSG